MVDSRSVESDLLWSHLKRVPAFRALLRAVESRLFLGLEMPRPILDLGCGDGIFAELTFDNPPEVGVDPSARPLREAATRGVYSLPVLASGQRLPFASGHFGTVVSNSVLEHIPQVDAVLREVARVLRPPSADGGEAGGRLIITVPSDNFARFLSVSTVLRRIGFSAAAAAYEDWFNRISRHHHCDSPSIWHRRLADSGLRVVRWQFYFSRNAHMRLEWGHYLGLPSVVSKMLFGHWVVAPWRSSLKITEALIRPSYAEPYPEEGAYLFIVAERACPDEVLDSMPAPQADMLSGTTAAQEGMEDEQILLGGLLTAPDNAPGQDDDGQVTEPGRESGAPSGRSLRPAVWLAAAMLFAVLGQASWNWHKHPDRPGDGLAWYSLALLALGLYMWQRKGSTTRRGAWDASQRIESLHVWISARAGRLALGSGAIVLSGLSWVLVGDAVRPHRSPSVSLILWGTGMTLVVLASWRWTGARSSANRSTGRYVTAGLFAPLRRSWNRGEPALLVVVALAAFLIRAVDLEGTPYILAGDEANMAREAVRVLTGELANPFVTGWFSHPSLYYFMQSIPIEILGQTTVAARMLSPFAGTLTVVALHLFARRAKGRTTAWMATILLAGYHFHIHFSRLGLNNSWDPLFGLLVLGTLLEGWRSGDRRFYVLSGLGLGLSQYFYMGSRLLVVIVGIQLVLWSVLDSRRVWSQRSNLAAMFLTTLVAGLPFALFAVGHPDDFMARMNQLGIFQSGWLTREMASTGSSAGSLLWEQLWRSALAFNYTVDPTFWYRPGIPLLRFWPSILFLLGTLLAVFRGRRPANHVLLIWLGSTIVFAGVLLENPPSSQRYVILSPVVCLLVAQAIVWLGSQLRSLFGGGVPFWRWAAIVAVLLIIWGDLGFYFGEYAESGDFGGINTEVAHRAADYLNSLGPAWLVYFYGPPRMGLSLNGGFPSVGYLAPEISAVDVWEPLADSDDVPALAGATAFLFLPERAVELAVVQAELPEGVEKHFYGRNERLLFISYEVERPLL